MYSILKIESSQKTKLRIMSYYEVQTCQKAKYGQNNV